MSEEVVIDTNLLIDLEERRNGWREVQKLIDLHNLGKIRLNIPAIMASEKFVNGKPVDSFNKFKTLAENLGFIGIEFLPPMAYFGVTFWDYSLLSGKEMQDLEEEIHRIIFPNNYFSYKDHCLKKGMDQDKKPLDKEWINRKCDIQMIWSVIYHKKKFFLTKNVHDFQKNSLQLEKLGSFKIMKLDEFLKNI